MQNKTELLNRISDKEERILISSVYDKLEQSYHKNYPIFSDFLDAGQIALVKQLFPFWKDSLSFFGGIQNAERQICYLSFGYEEFPIKIIEVNCAQAADITHRHVLGSLMGLGIKRQKIGDILTGERIFVAIKEEILKYVLENFFKIGKHPVTLQVLEDFSIEKTQEFSYHSTTVSSLRLDCIVAAITHLAREKAKAFILAEKVKVNHIEETNYKKILSEGDIISVAQKGRYVLEQLDGITKKERIKVTIKKYE